MRAFFALAFVLFLSGCGIPRDPAGTLNQMRGGVIRVGMVPNPPWVVDLGDSIGGVEGKLVAAIAAVTSARVEIVRAPEFELIRSLHDRQLQLVVGGFDRKVSWAQEVALTSPYITTPDGVEHVLAAPPGENAWLMKIESVLNYFKPSIPSLFADESRQP